MKQLGYRRFFPSLFLVTLSEAKSLNRMRTKTCHLNLEQQDVASAMQENQNNEWVESVVSRI
jgi:hypothetical protein